MKNVLIYFICCILICSCHETPKVNIYKKIEQEFCLPKQLFFLNNAKDTVIACINGTEILVKANSFCFEDSKKVLGTNDTIFLEVIEYVRLSDIIINNLSTLSNNKVIETGGMLNILAKSHQRILALKKNAAVKVSFKSKPKDFNSFYAENKKNNEAINWAIEKPVNHADAAVVQDTMLFNGDTIKWGRNNENLNVLSFSKLGWINCDRFLNFDNTTEVFVKAKDDNIDSSTFCSVILKNYNSIIPGKVSPNSSMKFTPLPIDEPITIFLISFKDGNYYMGIRDVTVKENETYSVSLELVSKEQLMNRLKEFDEGRPL